MSDPKDATSDETLLEGFRDGMPLGALAERQLDATGGPVPVEDAVVEAAASSLFDRISAKAEPEPAPRWRWPLVALAAAALLGIFGAWQLRPTHVPTPADEEVDAPAVAEVVDAVPPVEPVIAIEQEDEEVEDAIAEAPIEDTDTEVPEIVEVPDASPPEPVQVKAHPKLSYYQSTFVAETGGFVKGPDGVELTFKPDSVVDQFGAPISGDITARWTLIDDPAEVAYAPGRLATPIDGIEVPLVSFGMVQVQLFSGHEEVDLGEPADLSFPVVDNHGFEDGEEVGIYLYEPATKVWFEDGKGVIEGDRFTRVPVRRTGWWNCDQPLRDRGCVRGTIATEGWDLPTNTRAQLVGVNYMTRSTQMPYADGSFCLDGYPDAEAKIEAYQEGKKCFVLESQMVMASAIGSSCSLDREVCTPVTLTPRSINCEDMPKYDLDLSRGTSRAPMTIEFPTGMQWVYMRCGRIYTKQLEVVGKTTATFRQAPTRGQCKVMLGDDQGNAWSMTDAHGGKQYQCERKGRILRCEEDGLAVEVEVDETGK